MGYMLLPFDVIPDFIPVVGHLDDAVIVPLLFLAGIRRVPPGLIEECRERVRATKDGAVTRTRLSQPAGVHGVH
jgi:uncharacterized membrane protein YkvA (DUF1232 family)